MNQEYIVFYVSSHGFGHLTRSLAVIEHILLNTLYNIYLCSNTKQIEFAKIYLENFDNRVKYSVKQTDIGLINKENSLDVDKIQTEQGVKKLLLHYTEMVRDEINNLGNYSVKLIISDITALAYLVGEQLSEKVIGIGNFLWGDQYLSVGLSSDVIKELNKIYNKGTYFIKYDLSLKFNGVPSNRVFESDYLLSRPIEQSRVEEVKKRCYELYKEKTNSCNKAEILYLSLGKSAKLPPIIISNFEGVVVYTEGVNIDTNHSIHEKIAFIELPNEIKDSQSYIAASDMVVVKAGWSTTAESLVAHTRLALIERPGVDDDMNTIHTLKDRRLAISITNRELVHLDYSRVKAKAEKEIDLEMLNKVQNDTKKVSEKILEFIL